MAEIIIPFSMSKKMLKQNGCRVTPEAAKKLQQMISDYAAGISKTASEKVLAEKRKTINETDL